MRFWRKSLPKESSSSNIETDKGVSPESIDALISRLAPDPSLQCAFIASRVEDIAQSGSMPLIDHAITILASNHHYEGLMSLWRGSIDQRIVLEQIENIKMEKTKKSLPEEVYASSDEKMQGIFDQFLRLPLDERRGLAHYFLGQTHKYLGCYGQETLQFLQTLPDATADIKELVMAPHFYKQFPVTAVIAAVNLKDYEAMGRTFAHLRKTSCYTSSGYENHEIKELRTQIVGKERLACISRLLRKDVKNEEERNAWDRESGQLHHQLIDGVNALLLKADDPLKAFEAVGDAFLVHEEHVNHERRVGDLSLALDYYLASQNIAKIFSTAQAANGTKGTPRIYGNCVTAFKGFNALLNEFVIEESMREEVKRELGEAFRQFWSYHSNEESAIQAAELSQDFSALKENFLHSLDYKYPPHSRVYQVLKANNALADEEVMQRVVDYLRAHPVTKESNGEFPVALQFADLIAPMLDKSMIVSSILSAGLNRRDIALAGFGYLERRNALSPQEQVVYALLQNK